MTPEDRTTRDPPLRPDLIPAASRPYRRWLPPLVVAGVILALTFGGWAVAATLERPAGPPVGFPGVATVQPPSGWQDAGAHRSAQPPYERLTRGGGNLDVAVVAPYVQPARSLAEDFINSVLLGRFSQLSVSRSLGPVTLDNGMPGLRFTYVAVTLDTSQSIEGEVTVIVTPSGNGVVFDGWAPEGLLTFVRGDIHTMIFRALVS